MKARILAQSISAAVLMAGLAACDTMDRIGDGDDDGDDAEVTMTLADMPAPVREAILKLTPEANITQLSRETENGQMVYEVEYSADGRTREAEFNAEGVLLEQE